MDSTTHLYLEIKIRTETKVPENGISRIQQLSISHSCNEKYQYEINTSKSLTPPPEFLKQS